MAEWTFSESKQKSIFTKKKFWYDNVIGYKVGPLSFFKQYKSLNFGIGIMINKKFFMFNFGLPKNA